ncbi:similar to Saccharomyces cerevisiae YCR063W BUD31 Component of the SF3b subcomplex of the U2 snRNP [Geotrichum candidum]|uniref:Similar to Saccharomyces cerevisiae YCR063W BUD31 Component of the SF3b subcomplex of the U2 snRNP n=1 Tax=Geotrichum candidum TaxID=1173061 RepID=A0A0J9XC13_GEOCN|nr:similar to Saccharomyces cerevisiae YCR063W BUD31 Component of the SF3b subcomplex of the U2 snRNP [Geotrichum candidum]
MPAVRTSRSKKAPEGFSEIEDTLLEFENRLKDAEAESSDGKTKNESLWPIYQIHHQRSRYVYDLYYTREKAISTKLYQWLLKNRYADAKLIAKWRKQGYEQLCCLRCIQTKDNIHGGTCVCRVPHKQLKSEKPVQCVTCGCRGCASTD